MNLRKTIASTRILRLLFFPLLRKLDFKIIIPHPFTKRPFFLKFWSHKGYWYYLNKREKKEINLFTKIISEGDKVLEVGAHIGYLTQIFEKLVSIKGKVLAIEPSPKNFHFLKSNTKKTTEKLEVALSDRLGKGELYLDSYGGFTNSIKKELAESRNKFFSEFQFSKDKPLLKVNINIETVDSICKRRKFSPDFIKIDVEGAEYEVLKGSLNTLKKVNYIMIEIWKFRDKESILEILKSFNFMPIDEKGEEITYESLEERTSSNYFFIRK